MVDVTDNVGYRYQNVGPEYIRYNGKVVKRGEVFLATEKEHVRFQRRQSALFVLLAEDTESAVNPDPVVSVGPPVSEGVDAPIIPEGEEVTATPSEPPVAQTATPEPPKGRGKSGRALR